MIDHNESNGGSPEQPFSAQSVMRSLEQEMAKMQGKPSDEAQQLYYDAMEATTAEEEFALLKKALKIDPGNVDALLAVFRHCPVLPAEEKIEVLRKIVALGEQRLGPEAFKEFAGAFWGFIETRPYMRARGYLADALHEAGRIEEAMTEWEAMLELNPNDNQAVRFQLVMAYLTLRRLDGAARLLDKFGAECPYSTVMAWGLVLHRFLAGDMAGAESALAVARKQNAYTEGYIKGHRRLPKHLPEAYAPGSKDEAACFAETLLKAWTAHPKAGQWLSKQAIKSKD